MEYALLYWFCVTRSQVICGNWSTITIVCLVLFNSGSLDAKSSHNTYCIGKGSSGASGKKPKLVRSNLFLMECSTGSICNVLPIYYQYDSYLILFSTFLNKKKIEI